MKYHKRCRNEFGMTLSKFGMTLAVLAAFIFGFGSCSHDSDSSSGKSDPVTPTVKTYTEASDEEKALFTVTYDAEKLAALSHTEQTLTDAITITASVPWTIEEYSDGCYDTWAILSTEKSDATAQTTTNITLAIEDNLAEFWAGVTYDDNGNPDMSAAEMPDDRTTTLHILNAAGKQIAAITLKQTGTNFTSELVTGVVSSNHQFVGRGYNIFTGRWAEPHDIKWDIISEEKMDAKNKKIQFQQDTRAEYTVNKGTTLKELSKSFKVDAGLKGDVSSGVFEFGGQIKASYGDDYKETGSEEYGIYSYNARRGIYWLDSSEMIDCAVEENADGTFKNIYLTDGAYKAIYGINRKYKTNFELLFQNYGTHVIVSGVMGGRRDYSMRIQKSEISDDYVIEGYLKAGYKNQFGNKGSKDADATDETADEAYDVNLEADVVAKYEDKMKEDSTFYSSKTKSVGGSTNLTLSEKDWIGTLTDDNAALMSFQSNSLVPIWDLCLDEERAKAIENAAIAYAKQFSGNLLNLVGRIVLKDGSVVPSSTYSADSSNPAVGVIAYLGTGGDLGRKDTAYMIGVKIADSLNLNYAKLGGVDGYYGLKMYENTSDLSKYTNSQFDGTMNLSTFLAYLEEKGYQLKNFPAFEWVKNYGTTQGLTGTSYEIDWFIPSKAEVAKILKNITTINASFQHIVGASTLKKVVDSYGYMYLSSSLANSYSSTFYRAGIEEDEISEDESNKGCVIAVYPIPLEDVYAKIKN